MQRVLPKFSEVARPTLRGGFDRIYRFAYRQLKIGSYHHTRSRYQASASRYSRSASGWSRTGLLAIEQSPRFFLNLGLRNRAYFARAHLVCASYDFCLPRRVDIGIDICIQTGDQTSG
jgi:hypothetical protein